MIAAMRVVMRVVISLRVATALVRGTPRVSGSLRTGRRLVAPVAALRAPPVAAALRSTAELRLEAYEWTANYAAPASLVAGAVIASFYDVENDATMDAHVEDHAWVRVAKKGVKLLLMSAFALELLTVFITTITGTMLLSDASVNLARAAASPMGMLRATFEFEYLASRICFFQGMMNWLGAIALREAIPKRGQSKAHRRIGRCISSSIVTLIFLMAGEYNAHTEYQDYWSMLKRLVAAFGRRFYGHRPPRVMPSLAVPAAVVTLGLGLRALMAADDDEHDDGDPSK